MLIVGWHSDVPTDTTLRLPTNNSAVCGCGAVYDNGDIIVPAEFRGLCGRCAFARGMRLGDCRRLMT
ncbi:MAG: hypothetical protein JO318_13220 [Chloroflexi bacterium]|nr:hypothetical protein [Chloroflexota bacterium]MBV9133656.1 hypothetical protein [Chloroflexota bacterium]